MGSGEQIGTRMGKTLAAAAAHADILSLFLASIPQPRSMRTQPKEGEQMSPYLKRLCEAENPLQDKAGTASSSPREFRRIGAASLLILKTHLCIANKIQNHENEELLV